MDRQTLHPTLNTYDQLLAARSAGLPDVAVIPRYLPSSSRNGTTHRNGWKVWRPGFNISGPEGADRGPFHYDVNCRTFDEGLSLLPWKEARAKALEAAKAWAGERYGIREWKRNRQGDWVDARVHKQFPLRKRERS